MCVTATDVTERHSFQKRKVAIVTPMEIRHILQFGKLLLLKVTAFMF